MFHFGLPSEGLDRTISPAKKLERYSKLWYLGSGTDVLPLPLAKEAIFVDIADGERKCQAGKCSTIENNSACVSQNVKKKVQFAILQHTYSYTIFLFL